MALMNFLQKGWWLNMKVEMTKELWNAVLVAIDCDLDDMQTSKVDYDPHLDIRHGKMLQAKGNIIAALEENASVLIR